MIFEIKSVLDHGHVELYDSMGNDLSIVNAARVSFAKRHEVMDESDEGLIRFLMRKKHGTPFEHNSMTFVIKAPIFVFREWHRHRIASINEMSARYTELPGDWYVPNIEDVRIRVGKPGNYIYEQMEEELAREFVVDLDNQCRSSYLRYKHWLDKGLAPELARTYLHVGHYSEMFWTVNARSLMNFLSLRNHPEAQWEIKEFAKVVEEEFFSKLFPIVHKSFVDNGRIAP